MRRELIVLIATYSAYMTFRDWHLLVRIGYILIALAVLRFFPEYLNNLVQMTLVWHICEIIDAFVNMSKYDDEYKCTSTASTLKSAKIVEEVLEQSLNEKDSTSSSSQHQTDELTHPEDSMSVQQNTAVQ